jgi:hypothetical protein
VAAVWARVSPASRTVPKAARVVVVVRRIRHGA